MRFAPFVLCFTLIMVVSAHDCCHCPPLWTHWKGHCYRFFNTPQLDWANAEEYCNGQLANLVRVDNTAENNFLLQMWKSSRVPTNAQYIGFYIGLFKDDQGQWKWSDGYTSGYINWDSGQPDNASPGQDCGTMWRPNVDDDTGAWDDLWCDRERSFVCEFDLQSTGCCYE